MGGLSATLGSKSIDFCYGLEGYNKNEYFKNLHNNFHSFYNTQFLCKKDGKIYAFPYT